MPNDRPHLQGEEAEFEYPYHGNVKKIRYYSSLGYTIIKNETGVEYGESVDRYPSKYTYTISENKIEPDEPEVNENERR